MKRLWKTLVLVTVLASITGFALLGCKSEKPAPPQSKSTGDQPAAPDEEPPSTDTR